MGMLTSKRSSKFSKNKELLYQQSEQQDIISRRSVNKNV
jgi:hypothetical protein